jgi:GTPase SAR1 family protein
MEMAELRVLFIGLDGAGKSTIIANLRNFQVKKI